MTREPRHSFDEKHVNQMIAGYGKKPPVHIRTRLLSEAEKDKQRFIVMQKIRAKQKSKEQGRSR